MPPLNETLVCITASLVAYLHFIVPDGATTIVCELSVSAALPTAGTCVIPYLQRSIGGKGEREGGEGGREGRRGGRERGKERREADCGSMVMIK